MKGEHYTPLYDRLPRSSINLEILPVRWLFMTMLSQTNKDHLCYGTVESWAALANLSLEETKQAMAVLTSPDPRSSSKAEEGRRVLPRPGNRWFIVNHALYAAKNPSEQRRAIKQAKEREKKRKQRAKKQDSEGTEGVRGGDRGGTLTCNPSGSATCDPLSVPVPVPVPVPQKEKKTSDLVRDNPPTLEEVQTYIQEKGYHIDAEAFVAKGKARGWVVGKGENTTPAESWEGMVDQWEVQWRHYQPAEEPDDPAVRAAINRLIAEARTEGRDDA